jgi:hypothetical protein
MPLIPTVTASVLHLAVYGEAAVIVLLLALAGVLYLRNVVLDEAHYGVVAERDELRVAVATMREMSRTHAETITRIAAMGGKKKGGGR